MILWYLNLDRSKPSSSFFSSSSDFIGNPIPVPIAFTIALISSFDRILSILAFSTFKILPFSGSIAWVLLSLPCFAEPPADSPSTINSSQSCGSLSEQSASLPGSELSSRNDFLLDISLAFLAASLAIAASIAFSAIF